MIVSIIAHATQPRAPLHMVQTSDFRFQTSWQTGAMHFGALDACLSFGHSSGRPPGLCSLWPKASWPRYASPLYPPPPYRVWSCDIGKLWLSWKIGATLKVSNEHGSLGLNHCDSSGETGAVSAFRSFI